jgi:hypothetical protein
MALLELLSQNSTSVAKRWCDMIMETYPDQTATIMKRRGDVFANPVGQTINTATAEIVDALLSGAAIADLHAPLERIIRIRSIQDFSPSQAIAFTLWLKDIIRAELGPRAEKRTLQELRELEGKLEDMVLLGFDIYVGCRERYFEVRVSELKRSISSKMRRLANPDLEDGSTTRDADE